MEGAAAAAASHACVTPPPTSSPSPPPPTQTLRTAVPSRRCSVLHKVQHLLFCLSSTSCVTHPLCDPPSTTTQQTRRMAVPLRWHSARRRWRTASAGCLPTSREPSWTRAWTTSATRTLCTRWVWGVRSCMWGNFHSTFSISSSPSHTLVGSLMHSLAHSVPPSPLPPPPANTTRIHPSPGADPVQPCRPGALHPQHGGRPQAGAAQDPVLLLQEEPQERHQGVCVWVF